jgi:hypothetical protein
MMKKVGVACDKGIERVSDYGVAGYEKRKVIDSR